MAPTLRRPTGSVQSKEFLEQILAQNRIGILGTSWSSFHKESFAFEPRICNRKVCRVGLCIRIVRGNLRASGLEGKIGGLVC